MATTKITARNPQAEANQLVGDEFDARVLEPSPPTVTSGPYFADDPVGLTDRSTVPVLVPAGMPGGDQDWNDWLGSHPEHRDFVERHWLGGSRRLPPMPATLPATREALHRLAIYVVAASRYAANNKFGLRWTAGGFGTPFFAADRQVRVEGSQLVDQHGDTATSVPITSLRAAAEFLQIEIDATAAEHDSPPAGDVAADLDIDDAASRFLGDWFAMAFAALELVRADPESTDPSRPQIWPGHFDAAIEVGDEDHRASYGASSGDNSIPEPYLYISVWWPDKVGVDGSEPFWNAESFTGRVLRLSDFPDGVDSVDVAAEFWRESRNRLG